MKRVLYKALLAVAAPLLGACAASAPATTAATTAPADTIRRPAPSTPLPAEDVRRYRPTAATTAPPPTAPPVAPAPAKVVFVPPTSHVNAPMEQRLRDQAVTNEKVKYTQGYRILAYVGLEREKAMAIRREVIGRYPEETDYLTFKQPVYRLYIGDYTTKLEAAQGMQRVRPLAPKAELEATQVLLNKVP